MFANATKQVVEIAPVVMRGAAMECSAHSPTHAPGGGEGKKEGVKGGRGVKMRVSLSHDLGVVSCPGHVHSCHSLCRRVATGCGYESS